MNSILDYVKKNFIWILVLVFLIITNGISAFYLFYGENEIVEPTPCECPEPVVEEIAEIPKKEMYLVDIKGYVKKPGVYEVEEGTIINELIKKAGGLKSGGTTENINLSKKLKNEDMIVVLSKTELKNQTTTKTTTNTSSTSSTNNSNPSTKEPNPSKKVSINTASKEELMTISGIGESKALSIIEYRQEKKFTTIEEIMNVSGIGESLFAKIKEYITI